MSIGRLIKSRSGTPVAVVSSDAERALETAQMAAATAGFKGKIKIAPEIYEADVQELLDLVQTLPDHAPCVMLVGHNPGFEELAAFLSEENSEVPDVSMPTAGLVQLDFTTEHWGDVAAGSGKVRRAYSPREL